MTFFQLAQVDKLSYYYAPVTPIYYNDVVKALGNNHADVCLMNTMGYLLAHEKHAAKAMLTGVRNGRPTYQGQIIANVNSNINKLEDIAGKTMAYTNNTSTSGYLFPKAALDEIGVKPASSFFAMQHDNVVVKVYNGDADAGATYHAPADADGTIRDARERIIDQHPDVVEKIKVVYVTQPIPNDPIVFRNGINPKMSKTIVDALIKFGNTEMGKEILSNIYSIQGFIPSNDHFYDDFRKVVNLAEIETN